MQITFNETQLQLVEHQQHEFLLSNKEVALGYGTSLKALSLTKSRNEDELIENKHWLRLEVQTKGGKQKVIHWTKKGIVRLGFFIKSENAKKFRDWAEDYIVNKNIIVRDDENLLQGIQLSMIIPAELKQELTNTRRALTIEKRKHRETAEYYESKIKSITTVQDNIAIRTDDERFDIILQRMEKHLDTVESNEIFWMAGYAQYIKDLTTLGKKYKTQALTTTQIDANSEEFKNIQFENKRLKRTLIHFKDNYHNVVQKADNQVEAIRVELEKMTNVFQQLPNVANDGKNLNTDTVAKHSYWS